MKNLKTIPNFKTEDKERDFWAKHDLTDYFDMAKAERVIFPNLQTSTKPISLRLPVWLTESVKSLARGRDVPYQSLMKIFLTERVEKEMRLSRRIAVC